MSSFGGNVETPILHQGVFIDVEISQPGSAFSGVKVRGLIDTGSDFVLVSQAVARTLRLRHVDDDIVGGISGGTVPAKIHSGRVRVPSLSFEKTLPLYAVPWSETSHTALLGRSFLRHFVFRYDGPSDTFHFSKPFD